MRHHRLSEVRVLARNFAHRSHFVRVDPMEERPSRLGLRGGAAGAHSDDTASPARDVGADRAYVRQGEANPLLLRKV
jgi:hypothetical protein